ncbi:MAG: ribosome recycling factor [Bacteroidetes Order II. Incertae sedis bacterium]|nr:ribosome recycling factor [Bacteroidetes Order II. bacterium]
MLSEDLDMIVSVAHDDMGTAIKHLTGEFNTIRAGRANPVMLESVRVEVYGSLMPLNQLANVNAPAPDLLLVQPWDKSSLQPIEKAIRNGHLGLNPSNDGVVIRIPIPPLSEERRRDMVKLAKHKAEEARVAIRNLRRDANQEVKKTVAELKLSEDMKFEAEDQIQRQTDLSIKKIDEMLHHKEAEIMKV